MNRYLKQICVLIVFALITLNIPVYAVVDKDAYTDNSESETVVYIISDSLNEDGITFEFTDDSSGEAYLCIQSEESGECVLRDPINIQGGTMTVPFSVPSGKYRIYLEDANSGKVLWETYKYCYKMSDYFKIEKKFGRWMVCGEKTDDMPWECEILFYSGSEVAATEYVNFYYNGRSAIFCPTWLNGNITVVAKNCDWTYTIGTFDADENGKNSSIDYFYDEMERTLHVNGTDRDNSVQVNLSLREDSTGAYIWEDNFYIQQGEHFSRDIDMSSYPEGNYSLCLDGAQIGTIEHKNPVCLSNMKVQLAAMQIKIDGRSDRNGYASLYFIPVDGGTTEKLTFGMNEGEFSQYEMIPNSINGRYYVSTSENVYETDSICGMIEWHSPTYNVSDIKTQIKNGILTVTGTAESGTDIYLTLYDENSEKLYGTVFYTGDGTINKSFYVGNIGDGETGKYTIIMNYNTDDSTLYTAENDTEFPPDVNASMLEGGEVHISGEISPINDEENEYAAQLEDYKGNVIAVSGDESGRITGQLYSEGKVDISANLSGLTPGTYCVTADGTEFWRTEIPDFYTVKARAENDYDRLNIIDLPNKFINVTQRDFRNISMEYTLKTEYDGTGKIGIINPQHGAPYYISIGGSEESIMLYANQSNVWDFSLFKIYRTADDIIKIKMKPLSSGYMGLYGRNGDEYMAIREGYINANDVYEYETSAWGIDEILRDDSSCFTFAKYSDDINKLNSLFEAVNGGNIDAVSEMLNEIADRGYFPRLNEIGAKRVAPYLVNSKCASVEEVNAFIGALQISDAGGYSSDAEPYDNLFDGAGNEQREIFNDFGEKYLSATSAELKTSIYDMRASICEQLLLTAIANAYGYTKIYEILQKYAVYIGCEQYWAEGKYRDKICSEVSKNKFKTLADLSSFIKMTYMKYEQSSSGSSGGGSSSGGGVGLDSRLFQRLKYEIADGKAVITGITPESDGTIDSSIAIPEELGGAPVTKIALGAFSENGELSDIALPKTLECIENDAFGSLENLHNIWIYSNNADVLSAFSAPLSRENEPALLHCAANSAIFAAAQNAGYSVSAFNSCSLHTEFADGSAEVWLTTDNAEYMPTGNLYVADEGGRVISVSDICASAQKNTVSVEIPQNSELYFTFWNYAYKINGNSEIDIPIDDIYQKEYRINDSACIFYWENNVSVIEITPTENNLFSDVVSVFAVWENADTEEKYISFVRTACNEDAVIQSPDGIVSGQYNVRFSDGRTQYVKIRDKNDLAAALDRLNNCGNWHDVAEILESMGIFNDEHIQKMHDYLSESKKQHIYKTILQKCPYESCFSVYDTVNDAAETVTAASSAYGAELVCGTIVEKYLADNGYSLTDEQKSSLYENIARSEYGSREKLYNAARSGALSMQKFTVTFYDVNGEIVAQKTVSGGSGADISDIKIPDEVVLADVEGKNRSHIFKEWDRDLTYITSDTDVNPVYIPIYNAVFITDGVPEIVRFADNKLLADEPTVKEKFGYTGYWAEYSLHNADIVINAVYEPIKYTLRFVADGKTISTQQFTVENRGYTVPEAPKKEGYIGYFEPFEITDDFIRNGNFDIEARYISTQCELISVNGAEPENGTVKIGDCGTDKIVLDIKVSDKATYTVNGSEGNEISLNYGENQISVIVTAEHGESKEYIVYVKRLFDEHKIITAHGGIIEDDTIDFGSVSSDTDIFVPICTVSEGASYKIYSDEQLQNETAEIKLLSGKNTAYIKVSAENGEYGVYRITVTRRERLKPVESNRVSGFYLPQTKMIELTANVDGARIYYTTDGSVPTEESALYTSPIDFDSDMILTAIAAAEGYDTSVAQTFTYKVCRPFGNVRVSEVFGNNAVISFDKINTPEKFTVYMIENGNKTQLTDITVSENADRVLVTGLKPDTYVKFEIEAVYGNGSITAVTESVRTETEITDDCSILGISDPNARIDAENKTVTGIIAPNKSESISISVSVKAGAEFGFYPSRYSKNQFADNLIPLKEGKNTVYLKITASNKVAQEVYRVEIYRKTKSGMPKISIVGNTAVISAAGGAAVYYTTDGSVPNSVTGILYTKPFEVDAGMIIRAISAEKGKDEVSDECILRPQSGTTPYILDVIDAEEGANEIKYNLNIIAPDEERVTDGIIIFAEYDGSGRFVKMQSEKVDLTADEQYLTRTITKKYADGNIKIFLWNVFEGMIPLAESK